MQAMLKEYQLQLQASAQKVELQLQASAKKAEEANATSAKKLEAANENSHRRGDYALQMLSNHLTNAMATPPSSSSTSGAPQKRAFKGLQLTAAQIANSAQLMVTSAIDGNYAVLKFAGRKLGKGAMTTAQ